MGIGTEVRKWREARGITQDAFAKAIEATQSHYSEFECEKPGRWLSDTSALLAQRVTLEAFKASDLVDPSRRRRVALLDGSAVVDGAEPAKGAA